jgi:hypothetical protein
MGRRSGIKYFLIETTKELFELGRGRSKHDIFLENYEKYKRRESPYIHSYSTYESYKRCVAKFADFLQEEYNLKYEPQFLKLSTDELYECIDKYFERQKEEGLAQNTLEKHISALNKVLGYIDPDIREHFTPENRERWRDGTPKQDCDRYNNPDRIVEELRKIDETSYAIAELQRLTGARIGDVKKIEIDEENQRVVIENSKGGRDRSVYFDYFPEQFERVKECKEILDRALEEKSFSEIRKNEYYENLEKACHRAEEVYHGSHAFRYEWAQDRYDVISQLPQEKQEEYYRRLLEDRGVSEEKIEKALEYLREKDAVAEAIISEELGHSRLDISREYLKLKGK